jgi:hypothetical protein
LNTRPSNGWTAATAAHYFLEDKRQFEVIDVKVRFARKMLLARLGCKSYSHPSKRQSPPELSREKRFMPDFQALTKFDRPSENV